MMEAQHTEFLSLVDQRQEDLGLFEKTTRDMQRQETRLKQSVDSSIESLRSDFQTLSGKLDLLESGITSAKIDSASTKHALDAMGQDTKHRFETVSRLFQEVVATGANLQQRHFASPSSPFGAGLSSSFERPSSAYVHTSSVYGADSRTAARSMGPGPAPMHPAVQQHQDQNGGGQWAYPR